MQYKLLEILRCPVTKTKLTLNVIKEYSKTLGEETVTLVKEGILFSESNWFYPIIDGIPTLCVEALIDYQVFLKSHIPDYNERVEKVSFDNKHFLKYVIKKNKRTRKSFTKEWAVYDYQKDKTWNAGDEEMFDRFLTETCETRKTIQ